jgi:hypothetical protein
MSRDGENEEKENKQRVENLGYKCDVKSVIYNNPSQARVDLPL